MKGCSFLEPNLDRYFCHNTNPFDGKSNLKKGGFHDFPQVGQTFFSFALCLPFENQKVVLFWRMLESNNLYLLFDSYQLPIGNYKAHCLFFLILHTIGLK